MQGLTYEEADALNAALGQNGIVNMSTTASAFSGNWVALQVLNDATFTTLTESNSTGSITGNSIPAGVVLFGQFSVVQISSGIIRGYNL